MQTKRVPVRSGQAMLALVGLLLLLAGPAWALPEHTRYDIVLGQGRKGGRRLNYTDEMGFSFPAELALDRSHSPTHVYLADQGNGRVLGWRDVTRLRNGLPPDLIIGQPDPLSSEWYRKDARSISGPSGVAVDKDGTLWVSDLSNGRVLGFYWPFDPSKSTEDNVTADVIIGQPDFGLGFLDKGCNGGFLYGGPQGYATDATLCNPAGLSTDPSGNLYVTDTTNSRVLLFRAPIPPRGARAARIFGQGPPKSCTSNDECPTQAPLCQDGFCRYQRPDLACNRGPSHPADATTLCRPQGVFVHADGDTLRLYVADAGNNRVLVYDNPLTSGTATRVFGQPSMSSTARGIGPDRLNNPVGVSVDPYGVVWVSDAGNNRLLGFEPPFDHTAGLGATYLIGQLDAGGAMPNQSPAGRPTSPPGPGTLFAARRASFDPSGRMLLPDYSNHRVLGYSGYRMLAPMADLVLGQPDFVHGADNRVQAQGLSYPVGVAVDRPDPTTRPGEPMHLYVADFMNSRVLGWWDLGSLADGKPADLVIGQRSMNDYVCNTGRGVSERTLCWPRGVAVDKNGDLWVADTWNHRVLRFPRPFQGPRFPAADLVLGQRGFLTSLPNQNGGRVPSATSMWHPSDVAVGGDGMVWVADRDNDRVLGFAPPYHNGMAATRLLIGAGLSSFSEPGCPMRNSGHPSQGDAICGPTSIALNAAGDLWVAERDNNRVALYRTTPPMAGSHLLSPVALAILGQPNQTMVAPNGGMAAIPRRDTLRNPEGVSVEVRRQADGQLVDQAIVVADSGNNRVLAYAPISMGFQPPAIQVFGQDGHFDRRRINGDDVNVEAPANVERGLWNPAYVEALPEALIISDSGNTSWFTTRSNHIQPGANGTGNNRVLLIKGATFPAPSPTPWSPPDGGVEEPDLLPPEEVLDMREPDAEADLGVGAGSDRAADTMPPPAGCSCRVGAQVEAGMPLAIALLLGMALLLRRRRMS
ncbi:MAG: NHL repeat-containing protein [Myxococcales bacterium]|nr:NHL repeat-containing protein [Myxococcota bacterium]MDW8281232.1 NHL repeat-containing protein [Myxococcales bacterium]